MRSPHLLFLLITLQFCMAASAMAVSTDPEPLPYWLRPDIDPFYRPGFDPGDRGGARSDTVWYGQYEVIDGEYYAIPGDSKEEVMWTFDRGIGPYDPPPGVVEGGEGWKVIDFTANVTTYFRVIDETLDLGEEVPPPIISGTKSLWLGADKPTAEGLCWECGAGYGDGWRQRVVSEALTYDGSGDVTLSFLYWSQSEGCYDGTQLYLKRTDLTEIMLNPYPLGECPTNPSYHGGTFTDSIGHWSDPVAYERIISAAELDGTPEYQIIIEFLSDAGWSDEDCGYPTIWGPFGVDDITIAGGGVDVTYDFESGLQGWSPELPEVIGDFTGVADVGCYTVLDPCGCRLEGNVLESHALECDEGVHPAGQSIQLQTPICDFGNSDLKDVFVDFDYYAYLPGVDGVGWRFGAKYWPWVCENTGQVGWSPDQTWIHSFWPDPVCDRFRIYLTEDLVPADLEKVIVLFDLLSDCSAFTIIDCSGDSNFTPFLDNIAVGAVTATDAPHFSLWNGTLFQDVGSAPSDRFDPRAPGPANILATRLEGDALITGDSLVIEGPLPGTDPNTRWEARLWWRVARRAPFNGDIEEGEASRYAIWRDRVSDGLEIDRPDRPHFTYGWMDSVQFGAYATRNQFCSNFREDDDDFVGEGNPENEMLWDDIFYPGTRIEYFITTNYTVSPNRLFYAPDTSGGFFLEFEVLPGLRTAEVPNCGGAGFDYCVYQPATLVYNCYWETGAFFADNALRTVLNGLDPCALEEGCTIPRDRNWDRFDNNGVGLAVPVFGRWFGTGSMNGMSLNQVLGYRAMLMHTGSLSWGPGQTDVDLITQWLISPDCNANANRQVLIANGDAIGDALGATFISAVFGATLFCDAFNGTTDDPDCSPENTSYCVRTPEIPGGPFPTEIDIDAYGSHCPDLFTYNVFGLDGGIGNRYYSAEDGMKDMEYAQVCNEDLGGNANYRTILDAVAWFHKTRRDPNGGNPDEFCPRDMASIMDASISEIGAALRWGFGVDENNQIPKLTSAEALSQCQSTWSFPSDVEGGGTVSINRLYQNQPNPFNPVTTIRFSLAQAGPAEIVIYDVSGRAVRKLVDGRQDAGPHTVIWDGMNDQGRPVRSGVYWSQMTAGDYRSNKKMVVIK